MNLHEPYELMPWFCANSQRILLREGGRLGWRRNGRVVVVVVLAVVVVVVMGGVWVVVGVDRVPAKTLLMTEMGPSKVDRDGAWPVASPWGWLALNPASEGGLSGETKSGC